MDEKRPNSGESYTGNLVAGKYRLEKLIGVGAHGEVYEATILGSQKRIALKIFYRHLQKEILRFILKELKVISSLSHANILKVLAFGRGKFGEQMVHYLATPLMEGSNVGDLLKNGKLSVENSIKIAIQIAQALDYMHENKFIHRDVKPSNILLDKEGNAVLADFGIVCVADRTQTMAAGTVEYCAPEQLEEVSDKKPNCRWDIYSLGITLYEMLTGVNPYRQIASIQGQAAALQHKYTDDYPPITSYQQSIPHGLDMVVKKMIMNDSESRYSNMKEVIQELRLYMEADWESFPKTKTPQLPQSLHEVFYEAESLSRRKLWKEALQKYDEIISQIPSCAQVYYHRGEIFLQLKLYPKALENFNLALQYRPLYYAAQCQRAYTYLCMEDFTHALNDLDKAVELFPMRPQAFFYLALFHKKLSETYRLQNKQELYQHELDQVKEYMTKYRTIKS